MRSAGFDRFSHELLHVSQYAVSGGVNHVAKLGDHLAVAVGNRVDVSVYSIIDRCVVVQRENPRTCVLPVSCCRSWMARTPTKARSKLQVIATQVAIIMMPCPCSDGAAADYADVTSQGPLITCTVWAACCSLLTTRLCPARAWKWAAFVASTFPPLLPPI